jgi:hypothetical protein
MKNKLYQLAAVALLVSSANAAITISGAAGANLKNNDGSANVTGTLGLLIVDSGDDGFLKTAQAPTASTSGYGANLTKLSVADAGLTATSTFGGDYVLGTFTTSSGGASSIFTSKSIVGYESKKFAIVWFTQSAANVGSSTAGQYFGIARGDDWILPAADSGTYSFNASTNTTATVYWGLTTQTAAQIGSNGFFTGSGTAGSTATKAATFQIVPEPSAALLGAIGALGLLRRRRN